MPATPHLVRQVRRRIILLEAAGMTRSRIAAQAQVAPSTITRMMRGDIRLTRVTALRVLSVRPR